jgi:TfoX/Sxy family transcriptional regulator of competence genes
VAYDEALAERVENALGRTPGLSHQRMFGGYCFLINGHICTGVKNSQLLVRFPIEETDAIMTRPHVHPFGGAKRGWAYIDEEAVSEDADLEAWIESGKKIASALPPK